MLGIVIMGSEEKVKKLKSEILAGGWLVGWWWFGWLAWMLVGLLEHYCRKCDSWRPTPDLKVGGAEHLKKHG